MSKIKVEKLSKTYNQNMVLRDIHFEIPSGAITVILGKNGAGKTTLIKLLLNMIQGDSGKIYYNGIDVNDIGQKLYHSVSAILETVDNVYTFMTGKQNIEYFLGISQINKKYADSHIQNLIKELEMEKAMSKPVGSYSRGMRQKLALVIALMCDADIHFFDEPTLGLDFKSSKVLCTKIKELAIKQNKTIILTSHQTDIIQELADYVIVLDNGSVIFSDTYHNFLKYNQTAVTYYALVKSDKISLVETQEVSISYEHETVRISANDEQSLKSYLSENKLWENVYQLSNTTEKQTIEKILESIYG